MLIPVFILIIVLFTLPLVLNGILCYLRTVGLIDYHSFIIVLSQNMFTYKIKYKINIPF